VDSQWSQEGAGKASAGVNDDVGSESEPEASTSGLDPRDPELNFHHHPSAWRLSAAWMERWHATEWAHHGHCPTHSDGAPGFPNSRRISLFCGLSRESATGRFAGSQERVPLAVCLVFHRWSGHGDAEPDFLVFRRLSSESAADFFALNPQERIAPVVCFCVEALKRGSRRLYWIALSSERCVCGLVRY
jgi:hypothetical protein